MLGQTPGVATCHLGKPIIFEVDTREKALFQRLAQYFAKWGVLYEFSKELLSETKRTHFVPFLKLKVLALPACIAERCRAEPKLLAKMLREEAWRLERGPNRASLVDRESFAVGKPTWVQRIQGCPQGILEMINSRACRSAIMFNDKLSMDECKALVRRLAQCAFPFQCAHGRPSMVPIISLRAAVWDGLGMRNLDCDEDSDINQAWAEWIEK